MTRGVFEFLVFLLVSALALYMMVSFLSSNRFPVEGKTILITGGSQGLGLSAARILSSKGANVIIAARNREKLSIAKDSIAAAARSPSTQRFHAISAELTSPEETSRLFSEATKWNGGVPPDIVWANAGASTPLLFLDVDVKQLRSQMETNYWTAVYLARESLQAWLLNTPKDSAKSPTSDKPLTCHLIFTSSTASIVGLPGYGPYAPTKAALRSLHDVLQGEMDFYNAAHAAQRRKGNSDTPPEMKIHTILPGTILTPGFEEENLIKPAILKKLEESDTPQTAEKAAEAAINGLEAGRGLIPTQGPIGEAILGLGLGGSKRDRPALDLFFAWVAAVVWLFVGWDMRNTARRFAEHEGPPSHTSKLAAS